MLHNQSLILLRVLNNPFLLTILYITSIQVTLIKSNQGKISNQDPLKDKSVFQFLQILRRQVDTAQRRVLNLQNLGKVKRGCKCLYFTVSDGRDDRCGAQDGSGESTEQNKTVQGHRWSCEVKSNVFSPTCKIQGAFKLNLLLSGLKKNIPFLLEFFAVLHVGFLYNVLFLLSHCNKPFSKKYLNGEKSKN